MSRTFAYARVSTADQTVANQLREIEAAGFSVDSVESLQKAFPVTKSQQEDVRRLLSEGTPVASLAKQFGTSRQTIMRVRAGM
jgi:DNA invertase Pin-like site-specific DNA recombinase